MTDAELKLSEEALIDCATELREEDVQNMKDALLCYGFYRK